MTNTKRTHGEKRDLRFSHTHVQHFETNETGNINEEKT
jgi:hypothetical protein